MVLLKLVRNTVPAQMFVESHSGPQVSYQYRALFNPLKIC